MDDEELRQDQEQNPERCAYKNALEMLMNIHVSYKLYVLNDYTMLRSTSTDNKTQI